MGKSPRNFETLVQTEDSYAIFDDTVADKSHSHDIGVVRRQYSGSVGGIVKGIGLVIRVYDNAAVNRFWVNDYRIFDPDHDGITKHDRYGYVSDISIPGDYNGDGETHLAFYRQGEQTFFVNLTGVSGTIANTSFGPFGTTSDFPVATCNAFNRANPVP